MSSWARTLKLLDRLDNVSDLDDSDEEFRARYTDETISIIAFLVSAHVLNETQLKIAKDIIARLNAQTRLKPEERARLGSIIIPEKRIAFVNNGVHQN